MEDDRKTQQQQQLNQRPKQQQQQPPPQADGLVAREEEQSLSESSNSFFSRRCSLSRKKLSNASGKRKERSLREKVTLKAWPRTATPTPPASASGSCSPRITKNTCPAMASSFPGTSTPSKIASSPQQNAELLQTYVTNAFREASTKNSGRRAWGQENSFRESHSSSPVHSCHSTSSCPSSSSSSPTFHRRGRSAADTRASSGEAQDHWKRDQHRSEVRRRQGASAEGRSSGGSFWRWGSEELSDTGVSSKQNDDEEASIRENQGSAPRPAPLLRFNAQGQGSLLMCDSPSDY